MGEADGIDEAIEGMFRVGLTVAGRLGEQLARAHEQALRRVQAAEEERARELQARFDAERAAARAQLAPVMDNRWWDTAGGRDIERVHETATAWKGHDPAARNAAEEVRGQATRERREGRDETTQASRLLAEADREDRNREQRTAGENQRPEGLREGAGSRYDSAERRQELAAGLEGIADKEAVTARLAADLDQATPPTAAVASPPRRGAIAAKSAPGFRTRTRSLQKGISR